jgi:hypothetical protein
MIEIRFDKTKDEVALLIWFLVDHSVVETSKSPNVSIVSNIASASTSLFRRAVPRVIKTYLVKKSYLNYNKLEND